MVLKELPGKKASEGNPLLTVTTKVGMTTTNRKWPTHFLVCLVYNDTVQHFIWMSLLIRQYYHPQAGHMESCINRLTRQAVTEPVLDKWRAKGQISIGRLLAACMHAAQAIA